MNTHSVHNDLLLVGVLPETAGVGGVSIHLQRLCDYLNEKRVINYSFYDYRKKGYFGLIKEVKKYRIVHSHFSSSYLQFFIALLCRLFGVTSIMTLHGNYFFRKGLDRLFTYFAIRLTSYPIIINVLSYNRCKKINKESVLMPSFIPPVKKEVLDLKIKQLIDEYHKKGKIIVSTNAYRNSVDNDGKEVYGIRFLIDFFKNREKYLLLISDPSGDYGKLYKREENVEFVSFPHSYFELLKNIDVFVRNTSSDGDSLSVKESLFLNKPTLCTNVVDRPRGVVLFNYSDDQSFESALVNSRKINTHENLKIENAADLLLPLYKRQIDNN